MFQTFTVTARDNDTNEVYWSRKFSREETYACLEDFDVQVSELPWLASFDVGYGCTLVVSAEVRATTRQLLAA